MSSKGSEFPGRGMLRVQAMEDGSIVMEHAETGEQFEFDRRDLDEVIGSLAMFRMVLETGEYDDRQEENREQ